VFGKFVCIPIKNLSSARWLFEDLIELSCVSKPEPPTSRKRYGSRTLNIKNMESPKAEIVMIRVNWVISFSSGPIPVPSFILGATITFGDAAFSCEPDRVWSTFQRKRWNWSAFPCQNFEISFHIVRHNFVPGPLKNQCLLHHQFGFLQVNKMSDLRSVGYDWLFGEIINHVGDCRQDPFSPLSQAELNQFLF
jgi:hypothetical protein